jgi:hypothetical protein
MKRIIAVILALSAVTGCSGMEIGGKAWIASIDEKQESSRTYRSNVPLKCYFLDCASDVNTTTTESTVK